MKRILITGAAGAIGKVLRAAYRGKYLLRLSDNARQLLTWISHRDMVQLVARCIDHPDYHFVVVYGVSNNLRNRWDNSKVKFLGYRPEDDAEIYAAEILARGEVENEISAQFHGGFFTAMEFAGDPGKID